MKRRFSGRKGRSGRPLRGMDWDVAQLTSQAISVPFTNRTNTTSGYVVLPSDVRTRWVDPTLMATRTFLTMVSRQTIGGTPDDATHVGAGLIMWADVNDVAPTGADCPDPIDDGDLDWVNRWVGHLAPNTVFPHLMNPNVFDNTHLSKAKRRFGQNQGLLFCVSAHNVSGGSWLSYVMADVRALIKE